MSIVICKLPKAGLGNQLFPLMKALIFSKLNNIPIIVTGYNRININSYLKFEKRKRIYNNYFIFQKNFLLEFYDKIKVAKVEKQMNCVFDITPKKITDESFLKNKAFIFSKIPHWSDYFDELKQHRKLVIELLYNNLRPEMKDILNKKSSSIIGAHVRMGDFRKLKLGEDFKQVGGVRTPEEYFISVIRKIREINGFDLAVKVFTDGYKNEFEKLFELSDIELEEGNPDIIDILLLSKSSIIVTSAGSTFSYWAAFLSNSPVIMHPDHIHESIRPSDINTNFYEGILDTDYPNNLLVENIRNIENGKN